MSLQTALERLSNVLESKGVAQPQPATEIAQVDAIGLLLAPLHLSADHQAFWRSVDPLSLRAFAFPEWINPETARVLWEQEREHAVGFPTSLFPVTYSSHVYQSVEQVETPTGIGAVFEWSNDSHPQFVLRFASVVDMVDELAACVERGECEFLDYGAPRFGVNEEAWREAGAARLRRNPHPIYGSAATFTDSSTWPTPWR